MIYNFLGKDKNVTSQSGSRAPLVLKLGQKLLKNKEGNVANL